MTDISKESPLKNVCLARVPFEKRVAALWDFQVIPDIPSEPFDQKIAKIVTDKSVIVTKRG